MRFHRHNLKSAAVLSVVVCFASAAWSGTERISWSDLRPAEQPARTLQPPNTALASRNLERLVWHDEARLIQLTGFILPIDQDGDLVYEFMLLPWAGACSHSASPPPNQLVHVFPVEPFRMSVVYEAVTVTGSLQPGLDKVQLFIMDGSRVLTYGYSMRRAEVAKAVKLGDPDIRALPPGSFLSR